MSRDCTAACQRHLAIAEQDHKKLRALTRDAHTHPLTAHAWLTAASLAASCAEQFDAAFGLAETDKDADRWRDCAQHMRMTTDRLELWAHLAEISQRVTRGNA